MSLAFIFKRSTQMGLLSFLFQPKPHEVKRPCFHCGELMREQDVLLQTFDGATREVCCHGCAGILILIENEGMQLEYRKMRLQKA